MDNVTAIGDRGAPGQGRGGANMKRGDAYRQGTAGTNGGTRHAIDAVEDVTSLLGMPDGDLPAPVQACIAALMDEVERLRNELAQVRRHEAMLRDLADHHPTLPVQHRRAFLRELTKLLAQAGRSGLGGTVLHLHIVGIEALRDAQGPEAAEAALAKAIEILRSETEPADALGYLEGGNFALALALLGEVEAQSKAHQLAQRLTAMPFLWNGARPALSVTWSGVPFDPSQEADALLRAAELAGRFRAPARPTA
jgi:GGDEF domain-containing protein